MDGSWAGRQGGPLRGRIRDRYQERHGLHQPAGLTRQTIDIGGLRRTYWLASPPAGDPSVAPLLIVLHSAGGQGPGMASLTGLDRRGPAAGFVTVFPDGQGRVWNDSRGARRLQRREHVDDVAFLQALVARLGDLGRARGESVYLTGISNGGLMSEHLARHGLLPVAGVAVIAGPGTATSRASMPHPARPASVLIFGGTADPLIPYGGGPIGPLGRMVQRRAGGGTDRGLAAPAEVVAADWAGTNGVPGGPAVERLSTPPGELPVARLTWHSPGKEPVVLFRIEGGGHTWPGEAQYLPERFIGPTARSVDATGSLLAQFRPEWGRSG
ncbi:MAG: alpha/beta hydrolase family esterase [Acidimicrobiales bacterium]